MAKSFLDLHISCDLVQRHVARSLDHNLNILFPCTFGKLTESDQLFNLCSISCICNTSGTTCISQT